MSNPHSKGRCSGQESEEVPESDDVVVVAGADSVLGDGLHIDDPSFLP
jgi:hypothetical protein